MYPHLKGDKSQDPAQGMENYSCSADSNPEFGKSFDGITKRSRKRRQKGLSYSLQVLFEKRKDCSLS